MTKELIREISTQIFNEQILQNWKFYLLILGLSFLGAYLSSYIKKKGELKATNENYSKILKHLKLNTAATEEIKTQFNHTDWSKREWKTLRRLKLEELLTTSHETMNWLETEHSNIKNSGKGLASPNPANNLLTIMKLYFPELSTEIKQFYLSANKFHADALDSLYGIYRSVKVSPDLNAQKLHNKTYISLYKSYNLELRNKLNEIETKAADLMQKILEV